MEGRSPEVNVFEGFRMALGREPQAMLSQNAIQKSVKTF